MRDRFSRQDKYFILVLQMFLFCALCSMQAYRLANQWVKWRFFVHLKTLIGWKIDNMENEGVHILIFNSFLETKIVWG